MFKEILQLIPKLSGGDLNKMDRQLNTRFQKISKGFGKGLMSVLKSGSVLGVATTIIDKLLNPLQEVKESIDRTLGQADDVVTNAKQFNSTPGELFKLQKMAQATGLDADALNQLLIKYQGAVAEAQADPGKDTSVRAYANDENIAQSFFQFIQALNKMERNQQVLVQREVFGEKQTLKMADFLRTDFEALAKQLGVKEASDYTPSLEKLGSLSDLQDALKAKRELGDARTKGGTITEGMIRSRDTAEKIELKKENERIANYTNLQAISDTSNKIMSLVEKTLFMLGDFINMLTPTVNRIVKSLETVSASPLMRGLGGFFGKGK